MAFKISFEGSWLSSCYTAGKLTHSRGEILQSANPELFCQLLPLRRRTNENVTNALFIVSWRHRFGFPPDRRRMVDLAPGYYPGDITSWGYVYFENVLPDFILRPPFLMQILQSIPAFFPTVHILCHPRTLFFLTLQNKISFSWMTSCHSNLS